MANIPDYDLLVIAPLWKFYKATKIALAELEAIPRDTLGVDWVYFEQRKQHLQAEITEFEQRFPDYPLYRQILDQAEQYARLHWEVYKCSAHLSRDSEGELEHLDGDPDSYLVCLDMAGVRDVQRIVMCVDENGQIERDQTYTDDIGCAVCEYGHLRESLPQMDEPGNYGEKKD